jgi:hypothetical protein
VAPRDTKRLLRNDIAKTSKGKDGELSVFLNGFLLLYESTKEGMPYWKARSFGITGGVERLPDNFHVQT